MRDDIPPQLSPPTRPDMGRLFRALPVPMLVLSPRFDMVEVNDAYLVATGTTREQILGRNLFDVFPDNPDDPDATGVSHLRASLNTVLRTRRPHGMALQKYDVRKPDEQGGGFEERYWLPLNTPVLNPDGEVDWIVHRVEDATETMRQGEAAEVESTAHRAMIAALSDANATLARDAEEREKAQAEQELLLRELDHRVKNLFSIVGAIVSIGARSAASTAEMAKDIQSRIAALAKAQDLIRPVGRNAGGQTSLRDLLVELLAPHTPASRPVVLEGPDAVVTRTQVTGVALVLHELVTNAVKYGALSQPGGDLRVSWSVEPDGLHLDWVETGGPPVEARPEKSGFGTILAERSASGSLGGSIAYDWRPEGLAVHLLIPRGH